MHSGWFYNPRGLRPSGYKTNLSATIIFIIQLKTNNNLFITWYTLTRKRESFYMARARKREPFCMDRARKREAYGMAERVARGVSDVIL